MRFAWIPEAPTHPGLYANKHDPGGGKITGLKKDPSTMNPLLAQQFDTQEDCAAWCAANPYPVFEPREHGFGAHP